MSSLVNAQIAVGEINGSLINKEKPYNLHGYFVLIEKPSKHFSPELSVTGDEVKGKSEYLMTTSSCADLINLVRNITKNNTHFLGMI